MRLLTAALVFWPTFVGAATIDLTDKVAYNVGASALTIEGATFTAEPSGYLQFTGYGLGVCSPAGWSCNESEFPEALRVDFAAPVDVTSLSFGYFQNVTPSGDLPGYLPRQELAVVVPSAGAPLFFAGADFSGLLTVPVNMTNILGFRFFGLGRTVGVWGTELHGASLAGFTYAPYMAPPDPHPVPEPGILALLGVGLLGFCKRLRRRV